jgi:hypothetical protein
MSSQPTAEPGGRSATVGTLGAAVYRDQMTDTFPPVSRPSRPGRPR